MTEPSRAEPSRAEPNRTEPNRTEPNRTDPAEPNLLGQAERPNQSLLGPAPTNVEIIGKTGIEDT